MKSAFLPMLYTSTRGGSPPMPFGKTVLTGLAEDGGLLLPAQFPAVAPCLRDWARLGYAELAVEVTRLFVDLPDDVLRRLVGESYRAFRSPEVTPIVRAGPMYILELFHGPTLAFKDIALQFLGRLFENLLAASGNELNIVAATSGDTGSAAIHGVRGRRGLRIFVLYPYGRVSPVQERQMTSVLDHNVHTLAVDGTFDDCQAIVKALFCDLALKRAYSLGAVNSINWARILAQLVYYFYGGLRVMAETGAAAVNFAVPTGNFGDIFAGYVAWRMGLPIRKLILATNENDILARFFNGGDYSSRAVVPSISPSMDIQIASNFERYLYYRLGEDPSRLRPVMEDFGRQGRLAPGAIPAASPPDPLVAGSADTAATLETMREYHRAHGYLADPHTAVGLHVAGRWADAGAPTICLATAHPAKFEEAVERALGAPGARHPLIDELKHLPVRTERVPADVGVVRSRIVEAIEKKERN